MTFIEKLIEDTRSGKLDFVWFFSDPDKFRYQRMFDRLNGLSFQLSNTVMENYEENGKTKYRENNDKAFIVFPNGARVKTDRVQLEILYKECVDAIFRAAALLVSKYISGEIDKEVANKEEKSQKNKNTNEDDQ